MVYQGHIEERYTFGYSVYHVYVELLKGSGRLAESNESRRSSRLPKDDDGRQQESTIISLGEPEK